MTITTSLKNQIVDTIIKNGETFRSANSHAVLLGINSAQLSRIKKREFNKVLSDQKWVSLARILDVVPKNDIRWKTAKTPAFEFIYAQLEDCQSSSISGVFCDDTDIGKSHTARHYCKENKDAIYIDCSQVKTRQLLIREIAKGFGVNFKGRYVDVYADLVFYLRTMGDRPLVILDEAGDLKPEAFLEIKALWNATERACGWYMMGADGLRAQMEKHRALKKVGHAEIFRRFGSRYQSITPQGKEAHVEFKKQQFGMVAKANGIKPTNELFAKNNGSLERVRIEFEKQQRATA